MARLGTDWVFIGLGLGAIYLVYKSTKPVTDVLNTASGLVQDTVQTIKEIPQITKNYLEYSFSPQENKLPTVKEFLFKSPFVTLPPLWSGAYDVLTGSKKTYSKREADAITANNIKTIGQTDYSDKIQIIASTQKEDFSKFMTALQKNTQLPQPKLINPVDDKHSYSAFQKLVSKSKYAPKVK